LRTFFYAARFQKQGDICVLILSPYGKWFKNPPNDSHSHTVTVFLAAVFDLIPSFTASNCDAFQVSLTQSNTENISRPSSSSMRQESVECLIADVEGWGESTRWWFRLRRFLCMEIGGKSVTIRLSGGFYGLLAK
jgi:hypothetical protein